MSSLAWIDFDEVERQRTQRIMALLDERGTRDELGLGGIRDSISDHLFPGTNTLHTRLRYMLFIPWLFQMVEESNTDESHIEIKMRDFEIKLIDALKAGGEDEGVIGRDVGAELQTLPSSVYWTGLKAWGIRRLPGTHGSFLSHMRKLKPSHSSGKQSDIWASTLPKPPKDFLKKICFDLTTQEADFIKDRLGVRQPGSLLSFLANSNGEAVECNNIWEHPHLVDFPGDNRVLVDHCKIFSNVMNGATLIYNLELSKLRGLDDMIEKYQSQLVIWQESLDMPAVREWELDGFWQSVDHRAHSITALAKRFVADWIEIVKSGDLSGAGLQNASQMVESREKQLKKTQSRFDNKAVRDRWNGASGVKPLSFRWAQAKSHLKDLANAK